MASMKKRCRVGSRRCGSSCVVTRGKPKINSRCRKGTRRCPRKTGTCKSKTAKRRKRRYGRY